MIKRIGKNKFFKNMVLAIILFVGLYWNFPAQISVDGYKNFDWWSEGYMISDLMYSQSYERGTWFLQTISPIQIGGENWQEAEGEILRKFEQNDTYDKGMFSPYTSNIVVQRFFFRILEQVLPISNANLIMLLHVMNALFAALIISVIIGWIGQETSYGVALFSTIMLAFAAPYFAMYGKNLYWCMGIIFLPMAGMIMAIDKHKKVLQIALWAFALCLLKQMVCFEFISTVMVAMMMPVFFYCIRRKKVDKTVLSLIVAPTIGALLSFVVALGIKILWLSKVFGFKASWNLAIGNIRVRTTGAGGFEREPIPLTELLESMISKTMFSIKSFFTLNMGAGMVILLVLFLWYIFWYRKKADENRLFPWIWTSILSLIAPFSWFVLASAHTTVHGVHCSITWFCPFVIMLLGLTGGCLLEMKRLKFGLPQKVVKVMESLWMLLVAAGYMVFLPVLHHYSSRWSVQVLWTYAKPTYMILGIYVGWIIYRRVIPTRHRD